MRLMTVGCWKQIQGVRGHERKGWPVAVRVARVFLEVRLLVGEARMWILMGKGWMTDRSHRSNKGEIDVVVSAGRRVRLFRRSSHLLLSVLLCSRSLRRF